MTSVSSKWHNLLYEILFDESEDTTSLYYKFILQVYTTGKGRRIQQTESQYGYYENQLTFSH